MQRNLALAGIMDSVNSGGVWVRLMSRDVSKLEIVWERFNDRRKRVSRVDVGRVVFLRED